LRSTDHANQRFHLAPNGLVVGALDRSILGHLEDELTLVDVERIVRHGGA
jgi:hypothetical protein